MDKLPHTEKSSLYNNIEKMSTSEVLQSINQEDAKVAGAVSLVLPQVEALIEGIYNNMKEGGRLFYIGAGTSGRLGIVDASECPPTFGVSHDLIVGLISGGDSAIRKAVEFAEDDVKQAWIDLEPYKLEAIDSLIGIAASGTTPYVIGGLLEAKKKGITSGCVTCNPGSPIGQIAQYPVEISVGPEFISGSTRMKSGTAQKMVLNMISTTLMIKLGRIKGNKMVDMQLTNHKLEKRALRMVMESLSVSEKIAQDLLKKHGSVRKAIESY